MIKVKLLAISTQLWKALLHRLWHRKKDYLDLCLTSKLKEIHILKYGKTFCVPCQILTPYWILHNTARLLPTSTILKHSIGSLPFTGTASREILRLIALAVFYLKEVMTAARNLWESHSLWNSRTKGGLRFRRFYYCATIVWRGFDVITTFVGQISIRLYFVPSKTSDAVEDVVSAFFECVFRLHSLSYLMISDRVSKSVWMFLSQVWSYVELDLGCLPVGIHRPMARQKLWIEW